MQFDVAGRRRTTITAPSTLHIVSTPDRSMRGMQFGYRPKTNSYDGLTPEIFEQMVIDLSMFGMNQVELIPHSFDDSPYSPHFGAPYLGHFPLVFKQFPTFLSPLSGRVRDI